MKPSDILKISLSFLFANALSWFAYVFAIDFMSAFSLTPHMAEQQIPPIEATFHLSIFLPCWVYFIALLTLPFLFSSLWPKRPLTPKEWNQTAMGLEVLAILAAWLGTPPDQLSTLLAFLLWQAPVAVNLLVIWRNSERRKQ